MDRTTQTFTLKDGRILGFSEWGELEGKPVFHFNGSGGSRFERPADESMLVKLGIRYISTDRPGHGISSPKPDRELLDWPDDISSLADSMGIERFYVLGWSAGGPHALACAFKLPNRIISGALVCGLAPPDRPKPYEGYKGSLKVLMILGRNFPKLVYIFRRWAAKSINKSSENFGERFIKSLPEIDQRPFQDKEVTDMLISDIKEGYMQGGDGPARDDIIINTSWKFDISGITARFDIWQGEEDRNVPVNQGQFQATLLPNNNYHQLKGKGHMLLLDEWENILTELIK